MSSGSGTLPWTCTLRLRVWRGERRVLELPVRGDGDEESRTDTERSDVEARRRERDDPDSLALSVLPGENVIESGEEEGVHGNGANTGDDDGAEIDAGMSLDGLSAWKYESNNSADLTAETLATACVFTYGSRHKDRSKVDESPHTSMGSSRGYVGLKEEGGSYDISRGEWRVANKTRARCWGHLRVVPSHVLYPDGAPTLCSRAVWSPPLAAVLAS
ncbi:predicted protein [Postia placenta Mad-698-R]|nr:predicted protein [Postia placenta Mad-698-R]